MKILFIAFVISFSLNPMYHQSTEYVCLPCGETCDEAVYTKPGTCPSCNMKLVAKSSIRFKNISFDEMCARLNANPKAVLLDVRSPEEFNGTRQDADSYGHFKKAININVTELENRVGELNKYKDSEILVYCSHSHRSPRAGFLLGQKGFKNVKNIAGGVSTLAGQSANECLKKYYQAHSH
jgi:rhodanese-related sulfurtransferase/DNA-directed RNA polymerase subunit RPC12/RpoP